MGSARITDSSTISSHTTITRSAANAASFWQPSRPQICASPLASARCACTIATSGLSGGTTYTSVASSYGETIGRCSGSPSGCRTRSSCGSGRTAGSTRRPRSGTPCRNASTPRSRSGAGSSSSIRRRIACSEPTPGLPSQEKTSLRRDARPDHLVVDDVGGQAAERQVAPALPDDLVTRGEADQVREALDRHGVAVVHQRRDGVVHGRDLVRAHPTIRPRGRATRRTRCPRDRPSRSRSCRPRPPG